MSHILLTSIGLSNTHVLEFVRAHIGMHRLSTCAIIYNASTEEEQGEYVQLALKQLRQLGLETSLINIRDHSSESRLRDIDVIYIAGGNTFKLMYDIHCSVGVSNLKRIIRRTPLTVGVSAGSIICTPTIRIANEIEPDKNEVGLQSLEGLTLIHQEFLPHYREDLATEVTRYEGTHSTTVIKSRNDETTLFLVKIS